MVEFENMEQREVLETPNLEESPNETLDRKLRAYFDGKIVRKDLTGKFARPFVLRAGVQRIRRMRHKRTEQPALLHLHKHGGVRRVGAFRRAAARIARKELKCVRADRKRGPSHRGISL